MYSRKRNGSSRRNNLRIVLCSKSTSIVVVINSSDQNTLSGKVQLCDDFGDDRFRRFVHCHGDRIVRFLQIRELAGENGVGSEMPLPGAKPAKYQLITTLEMYESNAAV